MTDHLIWIGSYANADPKVAVLLTAYHIAHLLPLIFDAVEDGDWKAELLWGLHEAASRLQKTRFESNGGRVFEQRLADVEPDVDIRHGWVEITP